MNRPVCPRMFEVEAMRDGRLMGAERTSFERHLASCAACSCEGQALDALAEVVRVGSNDEHDELHIRRERTRLLAAFDHTLVRDDIAPRPRIWPFATLGSLALVTGALVFWRTPSAGAPAASPSLPVPSTLIQADSTALYSKRTEGHHERIVLERGALRIQVRHAHPLDEAALLVTLPDGELEDTGTTFTVTTADGRTTHVAVEEGSVVLRLNERPPIVLRQGEAWTADLRPPAIRSSAAASVPAPGSAVVPSLPTGASAPLPDASKDFRDAMAALTTGEHRAAAVGFARFLDTYPRDPRAEDAAYLCVVALHRAGDDTKMTEAARAYLRRYPTGFRSPEVEMLSRPLAE